MGQLIAKLKLIPLKQKKDSYERTFVSSFPFSNRTGPIILLKKTGSDIEIKDAEARLGLTLPEDYKNFILLTNGLSFANGIDPSFCPISKIDHLISQEPELVEMWGSSIPEVGSKMKKAIIVGGINEEQHFFLVPTGEGNWEYWVFASWIPGEEVYSSLGEYFKSVLETTKRFIENQ